MAWMILHICTIRYQCSTLAHAKIDVTVPFGKSPFSRGENLKRNNIKVMQSNRTRITYFYQHFLVKMNTLTSVDSGNLSAFDKQKIRIRFFIWMRRRKGEIDISYIFRVIRSQGDNYGSKQSICATKKRN